MYIKEKYYFPDGECLGGEGGSSGDLLGEPARKALAECTGQQFATAQERQAW